MPFVNQLSIAFISSTEGLISTSNFRFQILVRMKLGFQIWIWIRVEIFVSKFFFGFKFEAWFPNSFLNANLKLHIRGFRIRAPKVPFNFQFKIEMEKGIFAHFNFYFRIENWKMIKIFQFSFFNFCWKIENGNFIFHLSMFEFNCQITQVEKSWLDFFSLGEAMASFYPQKRKKSIVAHQKETDIETGIRRK